MAEDISHDFKLERITNDPMHLEREEDEREIRAHLPAIVYMHSTPGAKQIFRRRFPYGVHLQGFPIAWEKAYHGHLLGLS